MLRLPFTWEIEYKGTKSHIIGTHHCLPHPEIFTWEIDRLLYEKQHLLVETSPDSLDNVSQEKVIQITSATLEESIKKLAPQEQYELEQIFQIPLNLLSQMNVPTFCALMDILTGYEQLRALDDTVCDIAKQKAIMIQPLENLNESLEESAKKFKDISTWLKIITKYERETKRGTSYMKDSIDAYILGYDEWMKKRVEKADERTVKRNRTMVENSMKYLDKPSLIAVGLDHFLLEPSMITMYKEKGIEARRI